MPVVRYRESAPDGPLCPRMGASLHPPGSDVPGECNDARSGGFRDRLRVAPRSPNVRRSTMVKGLLRKSRAAGPIDRDEGESPAYALDIQIDEREGVLRIYDPRAFHAGRRGFCRRLVEAAAADPGFREGEIDLAAASCRLAFDRRTATARTMAEAVTAAIRRAAEGPSGDDRPHWWRRPSRWSTLTTYRTPDGGSSWETLEAQPGRIRLRHEALSSDRDRLARVTEALAALDGIEACRVSPWSRTLTLEYRP